MIVYLIGMKKYENILNKIKQELIKHKVELEIYVNKKELILNVLKISKKIAGNQNKRIITLDETGTHTFIAASKVKGMVCAQINDEHSAIMTRGHNGSNGMMLGGEISSTEKIIRMSKMFIEGKFDAGRHMVRIDMLNKMG